MWDPLVGEQTWIRWWVGRSARNLQVRAIQARRSVWCTVCVCTVYVRFCDFSFTSSLPFHVLVHYAAKTILHFNFFRSLIFFSRRFKFQQAASRKLPKFVSPKLCHMWPSFTSRTTMQIPLGDSAFTIYKTSIYYTRIMDLQCDTC